MACDVPCLAGKRIVDFADFPDHAPDVDRVAVLVLDDPARRHLYPRDASNTASWAAKARW